MSAARFAVTSDVLSLDALIEYVVAQHAGSSGAR
jgi:hypothetical protein